MAVTTIPWGDGSGDNIYLEYSASQGDQTVLVSSDANSGAARQKVITFLTTVGNISRSLTVSQEEGASLVSITWNNVCITYDDTAIGYQDTSPQYVQDGLVFWLDGIDKGEGANTWVDKVGGRVFTSYGAVFNPDHVYLDGNAYLEGPTTPLFPTTASGTIEVVYKKESEYGVIIVPPTGSTNANTESQLSFGFIGGYGLMWSNKTSRARYSTNLSWGSVSISLSRALGNGEALTQNSSSYLSLNASSPAYIGKRNYSSTNPFAGKIYCIRMYNRQLTQEEVLYNLAVDNQRFYLGNDYIVFVDSEVERICATTWGDGTGLKMNHAASVLSSQLGTTFRNNTDITSFNELQYFTGLKTIPQAAFSGCTSLEEITFPNTVTSLGTQIFVNAGLTSFTFPESLQNNATAFAQLFNSCASLAKVYGLENINLGNYCFTGATAMGEVHVSSIEGFCKNTFTQSGSPFYASTAETRGLYIDNALVTNVVIPNTITSLSTYLFYKNNTITSITIPSSVTSIGVSAFDACTSLSGSVVVPSSVTTIGNYAFRECYSISNLTINSSISTSVFGQSSNTIVCGNGTGTIEINGNLSGPSATIDFRKFIVNGDVSLTNTIYACYVNIDGVDKARLEVIKIRGDYSTTAANAMNSTIVRTFGSKRSSLKFVEITGAITSSYCIFNTGSNAEVADDGCIFHLGYDVVANDGFPCTPTIAGASFTRLAKIYVGDGSSASHDNAILTQYTSDTDWSAYTDKLDTWYNYINDPNANPDFIN